MEISYVVTIGSSYLQTIGAYGTASTNDLTQADRFASKAYAQQQADIINKVWGRNRYNSHVEEVAMEPNNTFDPWAA
ncbi:MAG: hypothetical protein BWY85_01421 [Firmicutes bacterium ADurb.Bin506]|nr:MAG: hypothetical protein BWY85_01421 [Firmicutes bacterium ADurb.Bin506]